MIRYLTVIILLLASFSLHAQDITGAWIAKKPHVLIEFREGNQYAITQLEQTGMQGFMEPINESGKYELLKGDKAILLIGQEIDLIFDIRELTKERIVASAGPIAFVLKRASDQDIEHMKQNAQLASVQAAIINNLRQVASAGYQYMLEEGATSVKYSQLEGEYFAPIQPVNGESYQDIVVSEEGGEISVTDQDGNTVTFEY